MQIVSAASAFPQHYYSQEMLLAALQDYWGDQIDNPHVLRRLHRHVGVDGRFLAVPKEEYLKMQTWGLLAAMGPGFCSEFVLLEW